MNLSNQNCSVKWWRKQAKLRHAHVGVVDGEDAEEAASVADENKAPRSDHRPIARVANHAIRASEVRRQHAVDLKRNCRLMPLTPSS